MECYSISNGETTTTTRTNAMKPKTKIQDKTNPVKELNDLIEREVPYQEFKREVRSFLEDHGKEVYEILKKIHG